MHLNFHLVKKIYIPTLFLILSTNTVFAGPDSVPTISGKATIDMTKMQRSTTNAGFSVKTIDNQTVLVPFEAKIQSVSPQPKWENTLSADHNIFQKDRAWNIENGLPQSSSLETSLKPEGIPVAFFYAIVFLNIILLAWITIFYVKSRKAR